ncbi:MAG TPA: histidinol phosphatase [Chitinophagaceae bacterium]|nr:histidinol phosphatase [Chitinophagaceae bacterium]
MLSFLKSKAVKPDLSFVGIDMHSHLLPALDDGLKTMDETIRFIKELKELGYHKLICTPHIMSDLYPNTPNTILPTLKRVKAELAKQQIEMDLHAGAEYMVDCEMEKLIISEKPLLTLGNNLILIEMSYVAASPNIEQVIFQLRLKGLRPVIAHPERYNYYHHHFSRYQRLNELGCLLQVNLLSLLGYYGKAVKTMAEKLLENNMVDMFGTDMHHENHLNALKELASRKDFYEMVEDADIKNKVLLK